MVSDDSTRRAVVATSPFCYLVGTIKRFFAPLTSIVGWLLQMFNPPPLESMNAAQKAGRVLLMTISIVVAAILFAMVGALGLYLMEKGLELRNEPQFHEGLLILMFGLSVNLACVFILLQVKKADTRLVPPGDRR